jgi:hypothetical protein
MDILIDFAKTEAFGVIAITLLFINFSLLIYIAVLFYKTNKSYKKFMKKLGNGVNVETILRDYIESVEEVKEEEKRINKRCQEIEKNVEKCIQKIGLVRFNAYSNQGSDLCFALALLDFEDNGVIINGIYSRDNTTTTYAKPVTSGTSKYTLTKEEQEALDIAKHSGYKYYMKVS